MMNSTKEITKRYQVFLSSTYSDLINERQKIISTILDMNAIPAGMEFFPAVDEQQMEHIKKVIDSSDYYVLITAGRYGSVGDNGKSFTEQEYDYAIEHEIPVLALIYQDIDALPRSKTETNNCLFQKQKDFIQKVKKGRLVRFWTTCDDLRALFATSFHYLTENFPRPGWVRGEIIDTKKKFCILLEDILGAKNILIKSSSVFFLMLSAETVKELRPFEEKGWITLKNLGGIVTLGCGNQIGNFIEEKKNPVGIGAGYKLIINPEFDSCK